MASIFDPLLNEPDDREKSAMLVQALRNQQGLGLLGMGSKLTRPAAESLQRGAQQSFAEAMNARQQARQEKMRAAEHAEAAKIRAQEHADLQQYRRDSLAQRGNNLSPEGLTPWQLYQQQENERKQREAAGKEKSDKLTKLSTAMNSSGMAELNNAMHDVNDMLSGYVSAGKGIPGIGGVSNIPMVGSFFGGDEGKLVRAKIAAVRNSVLKARSGGAVSPEEAERMYEELGIMLGASDKDLVNAWGAFTQRYNASLANLTAPYGDVMPDYQQANPYFKGQVQWTPPQARGGRGAGAMPPQAPSAPPAGSGRNFEAQYGVPR